MVVDGMFSRACATWRGDEEGFVLVAEGDAGPELQNVWVRADRVEALRAAGELVEPDTTAGLAR